MDERIALTPLDAGSRIVAMDVLRGVALLGILLMNIEGMVGPMVASMTGVDPALTGADRLVDTLIYLIVQGKFYPLFSLLFGMGFAVMLMRAEEAGRPFTGLYLRRVLGLVVIGIAHAVLVWSGDILVSYALTALLLLLFFRGTPVAGLRRWGIALMLLPCLLMLAGGVAGSAMLAMPGNAVEFQSALDEQAAEMAAQLDAQRQAFGSGTYLAAIGQRVDDLGMMLGLLPVFLPFVLGLFALGAWFVRSGAIARPDAHPALYARLRGPVLLAGLALSLLSWWMEPTLDFARMDIRSTLAQVLQMLGGVLMALGYLAWIIRALQGSPFAGLLAWLAPAGRMALTNYLLQSLAMTWLFYGHGLGFFEQLPRAWQPLLAIGFFVLQVASSHWWLAHFRLGPVEWLWRWATYGAMPPLRRARLTAP